MAALDSWNSDSARYSGWPIIMSILVPRHVRHVAGTSSVPFRQCACAVCTAGTGGVAGRVVAQGGDAQIQQQRDQRVEAGGADRRLDKGGFDKKMAALHGVDGIRMSAQRSLFA